MNNRNKKYYKMPRNMFGFKKGKAMSQIRFPMKSLNLPALGSTQPPTQWVPEALFSGVKQPGREADRSASAKVKKIWIYTSTPHTPSWHSA
jgi:hypothetical protein